MGNSQSAAGSASLVPGRLPRAKPSASSSPSTILVRKRERDDAGSSVTRFEVEGYFDAHSALPSPSKDTWARGDFRYHLHPAQDGELSDGEMGVIAHNIKDRLARSGSSRATNYESAMSSTAQLTTGSQPSLAPDQRTVDLQTAIKILEELRKTASPEDLIALHRALLPDRSTDQLSPTRETHSEPSAAAVIRSKSLARPGVATRRLTKRLVPRSSKRTSQAKHGKKEEEGDAEGARHDGLPWKPEMIVPSPLERLSSLDIDRETAVNWAPRAETPANMDYATLGNYQIGTLKVTNGVASPAPSFASRAMTPSIGSIDGRGAPRATSSESILRIPNTTDLDEHPLPSLPTRRLSFGEEPADSQTQLAADHPAINPPKPWLDGPVRSNSPLRKQWRAESDEREIDEAQRISQDKLLNEETPDVTDDSIDQMLAINDEDPIIAPGATGEASLGYASAVSLASIYMADLPPSPFGSASALSRHSQRPSTSHTVSSLEPDDEEFMNAETSLMAITDSRQAALDALENSQSANVPPLRHEVTPETALRSHPPVAPVRPFSPIEEVRSILESDKPVKADSGYSSGVSAGDSDRLRRSPSDNTIAERSVRSIEEEVGTARVVMLRSHTMPSGPSHSLDLGAPTSSAPQQSLPRSERTTLGQHELKKAATTPERPDLRERKSWRKSMRKSLPRLFSTEDVRKEKSEKIEDQFTPVKKLQKKRPTTPGPIDLQDPHSSDKALPAIPTDLSSRFAGRLSGMPTADTLDRTYNSAARGDARTSRKSLDYVPRTLPVVFPDADVDTSRTPTSRRSRGMSEEGPPPTPAHRFGFIKRLSSRERGPPTPEKPNQGTSFGDGAHYFSSSPYQTAIPMPQPYSQPQPSSGGANQVTNDWTQNGPTVGMDDETASRFAQMRSRERAMAIARGEGHALRPHGSPRLHSYHAEESNRSERADDGFGSSAKASRRPRSMYGEVSSREDRGRPRTAESARSNLPRPQSVHGSSVPSRPLPNPARDRSRPRSVHAGTFEEQKPFSEAHWSNRVSAMPRNPVGMTKRSPVMDGSGFSPRQASAEFVDPTSIRKFSVHDELPSQRRRASILAANMPQGQLRTPPLISPLSNPDMKHHSWQPGSNLATNTNSSRHVSPSVTSDYSTAPSNNFSDYSNQTRSTYYEAASATRGPGEWAAQSQIWRERKMQAESTVAATAGSQQATFHNTTASNRTRDMGFDYPDQRLVRTMTAPASREPADFASTAARPNPFAHRGRPDPASTPTMQRPAVSQIVSQINSAERRDQRLTDTAAVGRAVPRPKSTPPGASAKQGRPVSILKNAQSNVPQDYDPSLPSLRSALKASQSSTDVRIPQEGFSRNHNQAAQAQDRGPPAVARYAEEGLFGRYGGGFRHSTIELTVRNGAEQARPKFWKGTGARGTDANQDWTNDGADLGINLKDVPTLTNSLSLVGTGNFR